MIGMRMTSHKMFHYLDSVSIVCVVILGFSPAAFIADPNNANTVPHLDQDNAEKVLLHEIESHIENARQWWSDQECVSGIGLGETRDKTRRDPHDLLHQFGFTHARSEHLADAVRALTNVTERYRKRILEELSPQSKRQLCLAAGIDYTVADCPSSIKYRTYNGACNNLLNVNWGKAFTPFVRLLPAAYADDSGSPRLATSGKPLPSVRSVCRKTIEDNELIFAGAWTLLSMHFGQFLDHDTDHSPLENVTCSCETTSKCLPIPIADDDTFFTKPCFKFTRSITIPDEDCNSSPRQQLNQITSFVDLSQVYGSSEKQAISLRDISKGGGRLYSINDPHSDVGKELLPNDDEHKDCIIANPELKCGRTGDARAAEQPGLMSLHTIFLRLHNGVAAKLAELNPSWDDEKLYHEAKRLCIAMCQHVVYNEYLPPLLGSNNMAKHSLRVHPSSFLYGYDPYINPTITNVFATAAFRMGHSQVPKTLLKLDRDYQEIASVNVDETFFNATHMVTTDGSSGADSFLRGMTVQKLPKIDLFMSASMTKHLFADPKDGQGIDLAALNIQRGRDHGMADYNTWRQYCNLPKAGNFHDLRDVMSAKSAEVFKNTYENVNDIDLFPALIAGDPDSSQLVGPTLACLIGKQFRHLKFGDRFWYENGLGEQAFTKAQLQEIRKITLARIFCDTMNDVPTIQPYIFREPDSGTPPNTATTSFYKYSSENNFPDDNGEMPGFFNGRVPCMGDDNIPVPNLEPWAEGYVDVTEDKLDNLPLDGE